MIRTPQQAAELNIARARQAIDLVRSITLEATPNQALKHTLERLEDVISDCLHGLSDHGQPRRTERPYCNEGHASYQDDCATCHATRAARIDAISNS